MIYNLLKSENIRNVCMLSMFMNYLRIGISIFDIRIVQLIIKKL